MVIGYLQHNSAIAMVFPKHIIFNVKQFIRRSVSKSDFDVGFYEYTYNKYKRFAEVFTTVLMNTYQIKSVVDVGCGNGLYLKKFYEQGIDVLGYESSKSAIEMSLVPPGKMIRKDLRQPLICNRRFDLCLCIEVGEHLREKYAKHLVSSLTCLSDVIIFSAAHPGQGGLGHHNEKPQSFWIRLFEDKCFEYREDQVKAIKRGIEISGIELDLMYPYINLMIFEK